MDTSTVFCPYMCEVDAFALPKFRNISKVLRMLSFSTFSIVQISCMCFLKVDDVSSKVGIECHHFVVDIEPTCFNDLLRSICSFVELGPNKYKFF